MRVRATPFLVGMLVSTRARAAAAETRNGGDSGSSAEVTEVMPGWLAPVRRRLLSGVLIDGAAVVPRQGMTAHGADMGGHDLIVMLLTVAVLCNAEQGGTLRGEVTTLCWCPVGPVVALPIGAPSQMPILTPGVLPGTVRPLLARRHVFSLMASTKWRCHTSTALASALTPASPSS